MLRLLFAAVILAASLYASARPVGPLPALGGFLEPANGVWALARHAAPRGTETADIPGLTAPVEVVIDDRAVPHVFARTEEDAWRAQGYLVARDRLFQLELNARAASGRLSELFGARALDADRQTRHRGMKWAAERLAEAADSGSLLSRASRAYADGVNAWIHTMSRADVPLEYRLVGARPEEWKPLHTYYFFNQMALTLAYEDETFDRLQLRALVGAAAAEALLPRNSPIQEPIQPNGEGAPRYDFVRPLPAPGAPDTAALVALRDRQAFDLALGLSPRRRSDGDAIGSNNWAVAPKRTAAGYALLAGDPHLELTIPSIWYEIHLHADSGPDVAGVTFAGSPGVIIGFNRNVAWSFTNTGADVRDHYLETVDNPAVPTKYQVDGAWKPLEQRIDAIRGTRGETLAMDTVLYTHRGPMAKTAEGWVSVRWTPFEARGGEDFLRLDRAGSVAEWLDGWKGFVAPAQNGVVADRAGAIAIRSTGRYPMRPGDGRGDELRDGSKSASDWTGDVPVSDYPFALNPAQGFVASANQQPVDPRQNPRYFGSNWYSPWRAMRINQLLRADSAVTPDAMRRFQTDPRSVRADAFVPALVAAAESEARQGRGDDTLSRAVAILKDWDHSYTLENRGAVLFDAAMGLLQTMVWDELMPAGSKGDTAAVPAVLPQDQILLELIADAASAWWDDRRTTPRESRDGVLAGALRKAFARVSAQFGPPGDAWQWSKVHSANIYHALRQPALSALGLPVQGGTSTLAPSPGRGTHGPSWRMVVELGPQVRAWGTYPGGQSANPASPFFQDRVPTWTAGQLDTLLFPARREDVPASRVRAVLTLRPGRP